MEGLLISKKYIEGRLSVILDLDIGAASHHVKLSAIGNPNSPADGGIAVLVNERDSDKLNEREHRREQEVFVLNVKVMEKADWISIPSRVRLYDINYVANNVREKSLYFSTIERTYKFIPRLSSDKLGVFGGHLAACPNDVANHQVERCSEIMRCVSNYQGPFGWYSGSHLKTCDVLQFFSVKLDTKNVEVCLHECINSFVKLKDVMIGPFDL